VFVAINSIGLLRAVHRSIGLSTAIQIIMNQACTMDALGRKREGSAQRLSRDLW